MTDSQSPLTAPTPLSATTPFRAGVEVVDGSPQWAGDDRFPLLFVVLGVVSAVAVGLSVPDGTSPLVPVGLIAVAISPWVLALFGRVIRDAVFIGLVLAPVGFLLIVGEQLDLVDFDGGGPQLILMLVIGIVGQVATVAPTKVLVATTTASLAIIFVGAIVRGDPFDFMPWVIGVLLGVGGGRSFRASVLRLAELQEAQERLATQTILDERRRVAREVHDIVAHTMSITMLHLTAARLALRSDPDAAEEALLEAESHGRSSMEDIRSVVRLLRTDESSLAAALPNDADIDDLVDQVRTAGSAVELRRHDDLAHTSAPVRLAVYRVVQESLSNAARHGSGPVRIDVSAGAGHVEVRVENEFDGTTPSTSGTGLDGMRERISSLDGTLDVGPSTPNRWLVHARIPT